MLYLGTDYRGQFIPLSIPSWEANVDFKIQLFPGVCYMITIADDGNMIGHVSMGKIVEN